MNIERSYIRLDRGSRKRGKQRSRNTMGTDKNLYEKHSN